MRVRQIHPEKKVLEIAKVEEDVSFTYPMVWWNANPNKKPLLSYKSIPKEIGKLRSAVMKAVTESSKLSVDIAIVFLVHVLSSHHMKLPCDWSSYGRKIGAKDEMISPLNLVSATVGADECEDAGVTTSIVVDTNDRWLALALLAPYRMSGMPADQTTYVNGIRDRIKAQMKKFGCTLTLELSAFTDINDNWANDRNYVTIVAMVDMFFKRFPLSPLSPLRLCTITSRSRDCTGLNALRHCNNVTGFHATGRFIFWAVSTELVAEITRLLQPGEEYWKEHSYFHYQVDFGLVEKSGYSAKANATMYTYCHMIAVLVGNKRSLNARMILETGVMDLLYFAKIAGYAFRSSATAQLQFLDQGEESDETMDAKVKQILERKLKTEQRNPPKHQNRHKGSQERTETRRTQVPKKREKEEMHQEEDSSDDEMFEITEPSTKEAAEWIEYMGATGGKFTPKMVNVFKKVSANITNARTNSVNHHLAN